MSAASKYELQSYITNKRYKDGLKRCEFYLKKSSLDISLLLLKASFLQHLGRHAEAQAVVDGILDRKTATLDSKDVELLEQHIQQTQTDSYPRHLTNGPRINEIWSLCALATHRSRAAAIYHDRLTSAILDRRWQDASTALQAWRKAAPSDRNLKYMHIAVQTILSEIDRDPKTANLCRLLAAKTLEQTPVESAAELRTAIHVHSRVGGSRKALIKVFDQLSDSGSSLLNDWEFTRSRLATLQQLEAWAELKTLCEELLGLTKKLKTDASARAKDDWLCWQCYIQACVECGVASVEQVLGSFPQDNPRSLSLARIKMSSLMRQKGHTDATVANSALLSSIIAYFDKFHTEPFCFGDLRDVVTGQLDNQSSCAFQQYIAKVSILSDSNGDIEDPRSIVVTANVLKLKYLLSEISGQPSKRPILEDLLLEVLQAEQVHTRASSTMPDLAFLATSILIQLHELNPSASHLCKAALLLEPLANQRVFQAQVSLVYIYQEIGLFSKAMQFYTRLRVREIQNESFAHAVMTRISVIHPWDFENRASTLTPFQPYSLLHQIVNKFHDTEYQCYRFSSELPINGRTDMLFELTDLRTRLDRSITRRILLLEQRRTARLTGRPSETQRLQPAVFEHWVGDIQDSRDYQTAFHYGPKQDCPTLEYRLQSRSGIPNRNWIHYTLFIDEIWSSIQSQNTSLLTTGTPLPIPVLDASLSAAEAALLEPWKALNECVTLSREQQKAKNSPFTNALDALHKSLQDTSKIENSGSGTKTLASASSIQSFFLTMDLLKATAKFCNSRRPAETNDRKRLATILESTRRLFKDLQVSAREIERGLSPRSVVAGLQGRESSDGQVYALLRRITGEDAIHAWAESAVVSARDAWEGVLRVRLEDK